MENFDPKTIIYFVLAILWLIFNAFKKNQQKQAKPAAPPPPKNAGEIKEMLERRKREKQEKVVIEEPVRYYTLEDEFFSKTKNPPPQNTEEIFRAEEHDEQPVLFIDQDEARKMVIYSEVLKRPVY